MLCTREKAVGVEVSSGGVIHVRLCGCSRPREPSGSGKLGEGLSVSVSVPADLAKRKDLPTTCLRHGYGNYSS